MNKQDQERIRAGGVCIKDGKVLLIHRINLGKENDQEYFVIPGGGVEENEDIKEAVIRELGEETGIKVKVNDIVYETESFNSSRNIAQHEYYYLCEYISGEPALREDSEEAEEMKLGKHFYKPMWVSKEEAEKSIVYPEEVKSIILKMI